MNQSTEKPYEEVNVPAAENPAAGWSAEWDAEGKLWRLAGKCPRCAHDCVKEVFDQVVVLALQGAPEDDPDVGTHVVQCSCSVAHPERPDEVANGCGAFWGIQLKHPAGSRP